MTLKGQLCTVPTVVTLNLRPNLTNVSLKINIILQWHYGVISL